MARTGRDIAHRAAGTAGAVVPTKPHRPARGTDTQTTSPQSRLAGTVEAMDDLIAPAFDPEAFIALAKTTRTRRRPSKRPEP